MEFADLHIHTSFSDSSSDPLDVIKRSKEAGLAAISITDHDSIDGIKLAVQEGQKQSIEVIPGIEMTSEIDEKEIHILGYFVDINNEDFLSKLQDLQQIRVERIFKMVEKLKELGVNNLDAKEVIEFAGKGAVGRLHLAIMLQKKGWIYSPSEAFYKYIGDKCPAYVSKFNLSPVEVVNIIKKSGGIAVLAHPHVCTDATELIDSLAKVGLRGLEVYYPKYTAQTIGNYKAIAEKYGLLLTGGSDDHGLQKDDTLIGKVKIPYELVEKLKQEKCQNNNSS